MPDDCIIAYDYKGKGEDIRQTDIYDLYAQTSRLGTFGQQATDGNVKQLVDFKEAPTDFGPSDFVSSFDPADVDLFA